MHANTHMLETMAQQIHRTAQTRNMLDANIFPTTAGNNTGHLVAECTASRFQVDCGAVGSNEVRVHEVGERDIYVTLAVIVLGIFAGTLAISCVLAAMLCTVVRLLRRAQVRAFGMIWLIAAAACWVVCLIGLRARPKTRICHEEIVEDATKRDSVGC